MKKYLIFIPLLFIANLTFASYEISDGSVKALYHMNGSSVDSSGNAHNGTDTSMTYSSAKLGSASAVFSGGSAKIIVPESTDFSFAGDFTISLWYYTATGPLYPTIIQDVHNAGFNSGVFGLRYDNYLADTKFSVHAHNGTPYDPLFASGNYSAGNWEYLTLERSGTTITLYVNNSADGSGTYSSTFNLSTDGMAIGGGTFDGANSFLNGNIDELVILNRAITSDERAALYNAGNGVEVCVSEGCGDIATSTASSTIGFMSPQLDFMFQLFLEMLFVVAGIIVGYLAIKKLTKK